LSGGGGSGGMANQDNTLWLSSDMEEECYVGRHLANIVGVAVPGLLVYCVGMPLVAFLILYRHQRQQTTNKYVFRLGLLYSGYRRDRWWWEGVVVIRKVGIILTTTFLYSDTLQLHVMMLILILSYAAHHTWLPFHVVNLDNGGGSAGGSGSTDVRGRRIVQSVQRQSLASDDIASEVNVTMDGLLLHKLERNSLLVLLLLLWSASVFVVGTRQCDTWLCVGLTGAVFVSNVIFIVQGFSLFVKYFLQRTKLAARLGNLLAR
jgi:hypothetical protein